MRYRQPFAQIRSTPDGLEFHSSYDPGLVAALKARIPASERKWDNSTKVWVVAPSHGSTLSEITMTYLGITVDVPRVAEQARTETKMIKLEYLGAAKDRDGESYASGWVDGGWNAIFPLRVLESWFCIDTQQPIMASSLYATLGIKRDADAAAIKSAYRRLARQWHPDTCQEPGAAMQFIAIKEAYDVLSNPQQRARYEAGLQLTANIAGQPTGPVWRPPLRCGWLLVECTMSVGRYLISRIFHWEDIVRSDGLVLVSYWPSGATEFATRWA